MLSEPGEEWLAITRENFVVEVRGASAQLQAWDERRNLVRRVTAIQRETRGKLVLKVARFGKLQGGLGTDRPAARAARQRTSAQRPGSGSANSSGDFCAVSSPPTNLPS